MRYVGIENSKLKSEAVKRASKIGKKTTLDLPCITAPDCERHFEILRLLDCGINTIDGFKDTQYYKFNSKNGKSDSAIMEKINKFKSLYESIKKNGYDYNRGYIILSDDGARLDGSHRASVVEHLGLKELTVLVIKWTDLFKEKDLKDLRKHIQHQKETYGV